MATMKDVAKKAGVSLSTVSYVLSGSRPISEETKAKVFQAMTDLDFHPNAVARALASRRSGVIALLFAPTERGLGITELELVKAASEAARSLDYHIVLLTEGMDGREDLRFLKQQRLVDGVILMEIHQDDQRIKLLRELDLPFSAIGRSADMEPNNSIDIDFDTTMQQVVSHLTGLGHRKIAFLNQPSEIELGGYGPAVRSEAAFLYYCAKSQIQGQNLWCHATPRDGYESTRHLLKKAPELTALICMNDRALPGVLQALAEAERQVPKDFSLVATVSSARAAEMMVPALSSADVPSRDLARTAVTQLIGTLTNSPQEPGERLFPCPLVVRNSSAAAPKT